MSAPIELTDDLLHEALRVPAGVGAPADLVDSIMAEVNVTVPGAQTLARNASWRRLLVPVLLLVALLLAVALAIPIASPAPRPPISDPVVAPDTSRAGTTTDDALWLPGPDGSVAKLDRGSLATVGVTRVAEHGSPVEAVAASDEGVWTALPAERAVILLDGSTGTELRRVELDVAPYALAVEGADLWVTDFEGDRVLRLDRATGEARTTVSGIDGPTGIAIGEGGVWVAANGSSRLVRIDPAIGQVVAQAILPGKPHSLAVGAGGVWTANGRTGMVSRYDPVTDRVVATVDLDAITYDIEVVGDGVWVTSGPEAGCEEGSAVSRIDPITNAITSSLPFPCAWALVADGDTLWVNGSDERGTLLARVWAAEGGSR